MIFLQGRPKFEVTPLLYMQTNFKIPSKLVKRAPQLSVIFLITPCCLTGTLGDFSYMPWVFFSAHVVIFSAW